MNILFVHQNMPGQYRELVQWLAAQETHKIYFLTQRKNAPKLSGVETIIYKPHRTPTQESYGLSRVWEEATGAGFGAAMAAKQVEKQTGFKPDIIIGHVGWGELTFFKQIWPDVPIIGFFEFYYNMMGGTVGFDPAEPVSEHAPFLMQARNAIPLANIETVDQGHCPTMWQRDRFPTSFHDRMYVCHDGIRTDKLLPNPKVKLGLGRVGRDLTRDDEIITYVARNLEKTRGFHTLMRALPQISPTYAARIFCLARGGDWQAAALTLLAEVLGGGQTSVLNRALQFDQPANALVFSPALLGHSLPAADTARRRDLERTADEKLQALRRVGGVTGQVIEQLHAGLGERPLTVHLVADRLQMTARTLQRRLHHEGAQFARLRDQVRMEYACRRLRRGDCDMPELARRLGFSDIANFYHAFRRWTGCAPGAYRKNQVRRR